MKDLANATRIRQAARLNLNDAAPDPMDGEDDEPDSVIPSDEELSEMTVDELKHLLNAHGLLLGGNKAAKIERLKAYRVGREPGKALDPQQLLYKACVRAWYRVGAGFSDVVLDQFFKGHKVGRPGCWYSHPLH